MTRQLGQIDPAPAVSLISVSTFRVYRVESFSWEESAGRIGFLPKNPREKSPGFRMHDLEEGVSMSGKNTKKNLNWMAAAAVVVGLAIPAAAQESTEEAPEPNWTNELGLSYVGTSGNTETSTLGLDFKSTRKPTPWGLELYAMFTRSEDDGELTAEQYLVGGRAIRELNERWSVFGGLSWAKDPFTGFDNKYLAEIGAIYLAVDTERHQLSFDAGLSWNSEDQIFEEEILPPTEPPTFREYTENVSWFGGLLGLTWDWAISANASLNQRLLFTPNFDDTEDWRLGSDTSITAAMTELLALKFSYLVRYRNLPIEDRESTDTTTKVSVVLNF
jgi:putative salt-induced outer membrane protein